MATTTNFGWETPDDTDLVKDGAAAMRTLGNAIDTSFLDLKGGTTGQILSKASNTDLDYTWITNDVGDITEVAAGTGISGGGTSGSVTITNSMATAIDAKGDLIGGTGADTFARLAVGTNGQVLTADSTATTGLKWDTPVTGGMTLISTTSLSGSSISLTSISSSYNTLVLCVRDYYAASNSNFGLRLNNDSGGNYFETFTRMVGTTISDVKHASQDRMYLDDDFTNADKNNFMLITIPDYTNTATKKIVNFSFSGWNSASNAQSLGYGTGVWGATPAAIDRIDILSGAGNWSGGSVLLYGVK